MASMEAPWEKAPFELVSADGEMKRCPGLSHSLMALGKEGRRGAEPRISLDVSDFDCK